MGFGSLREDNIYSYDGTSFNITFSSRPYFSYAVENTFLTEPYIDSASDQLCVSIAKPIKDYNNTIDILILDLNLSHMATFMDNMLFVKQSTQYLFLIKML